MKKIFTLIFCLSSIWAIGQTNIVVTNTTADQVMKRNYSASTYQASTILNQPNDIINGIQAEINTDSLKEYLIELSTFRNRNTGSDTVSTTEGIGASRRWAYSKFQEFSAANENRLLTSYLQFDQIICGIGQHRNIFAVLPGMDVTDNSLIIIEGHIDSRCSGVCDTACVAEGIEDNASGTALVLELARVMSQYSFNHTIVFLITIGEEQGLNGANAFAEYVLQNNIPVRGVWNNDVIGGVACGETSSPPSCPGLNHLDSTSVRIFSQGGSNSRNKGLARFIKLQYEEEMLPTATVPMIINIMSAEDRTGRGGDHIPFRQKGYTACRFTSANEHGDASNDTGYSDRQHTSTDILGLDLDGDMVLDTFFVNFNYLARNAAINGVSAGLAAIGPKNPSFTIDVYQNDKFVIAVTDQTQYAQYRLGLRRQGNDFDTLITINGAFDTIAIPENALYYISLAALDTNGVESLFTQEFLKIVNTVTTVEQFEPKQNIKLLQNRPNPFDEATHISFYVEEPVKYDNAHIVIYTLSGQELVKINTEVRQGVNEMIYHHGFNATGSLIYSLFIDGQLIASKRMIFAY
jgi:hypothetical protein